MTIYSSANGLALSTSGNTTRWAINTSGAETQVGTSGNDAFSGAGGDVLIGSLGDDTYYLWDNRETVIEQAGQGTDTIVVNYWGAATLPEGVENLILNTPGANSGTGNALDNIIIAGSVGAALDGDAGNDILVGGAGADLFILKAGNGSDAIVNFAPSADIIKLQGYGITRFDQLTALATQNGADVKFAFANGESLVLRNVSLSTLSAYDFSMQPSSPASLTGLSQMVGPAKAFTANGWTIVNNVWNPGRLVYGTDYSVSTAYAAADLTKQTTFSWSFPIVIDPNPVIRAYQEISYGLNPYAATSSSPVNSFAIQLSSLSNLDVTYDVEYHGNLAGFDVAFDLWLTSRPNGDASTITNEVMIWLHKGGISPFGTQIGTYSDAGVSAKIYYQPGFRPYTAVILDTDSTTGVIDIDSILAKLESLGVVSTSEYLASLEFGAEIGSGAGTLAIHSLDLTVAKNPSSSSDAAPLAPTITASSPDSAGLASGLTNVNHVTLIGTAQVGTTVQIFDGTRQIGTAVVGGSGTWSFATAALADGTHALNAKVVNGAGGVSAASSAINLIVDTTPPNVPAIIAFSPNSNVSHEGSTNANHVTLNGTAEAGSNVRIFDGSAQVGTLTASASGVWSFTTGLLTDGTHSFTSAAMDAAGNVSALSAPLNAVVDTIVPSAPVIKSFSPDSDTTGDGITNVNQIILTGTAEAGSSVQVFDGSTQVGAATANASGAWSFATAKLANGSHNFAAKAVDAATNTSALSTVLEVVVDTIAPAAPVVVSDTAATGTSMNVSGTAEAGALVRLYEGAKLLGTSTAALNGTWTINSGNLSAGAHAFSATATDAAGNVSALSNILDPIIGTAIESAGTTTLMQAGNNYYLSGIGADVLLKYSGAAVQSGQFDNFAPVAAEQISTGYEVAWKNAVTNQYSVWSTDANGSYTGNLYMPGPGTSADFQRLETSFHQDLNGDGKIGVVQSASSSVIEAIGATTLAVSGSNYLLNSVNGGTGPTLKYQGAVVTIGQFDGYTSIGVEAIPNGYEVAWKNASTGNYSVWSTDANGNYTGNLYMPGSGTSAAFQTLETSFQQDLNGDGKIGAGQSASSSVIEAIGATALAVSGSNYLLNSVNGGTGPTLKYQGAVVTIGQFDGYASIGVEAIPNGYEVAWKNASTGNYSVWSTDANGNYTGNLYMPGSGTSAAFQTLETSFQQDLNGDGKIGAGQSASSSVIEAIGATALAVYGSNYLLNSVNGGTGPTLKYQGAAVAIGQFDDYTPIGVEAVSNGYEVAWKNTTTGNYSVWSTDTSGNYTGNFYMPGSGTDGAFKALETSFQQDLNGDGVINSISTVIDVVGKATLNLAKMIQEVIIESGASVEITGAASGSFTFKAVTGTLVLDHASQFIGKIFGLSGNGDENASDLLDLKDISYGSGTTMSYSGDHSGGMLTVKDAQNHTANIALIGDYTHSTFNLLSDGGGGTLVIDPPVDQFQFARPAVMTPLAGAVVGHPSDSLSVFQAGGPQELYEGAVGPFDFSAYVVAQTQIGFVNSAHALQNHTEILDVMRMAQDHKIWTDGVLLHA